MSVTAAGKPPPVRVRRPPPLEPPFEDELDPSWPVRRALPPAVASGASARTASTSAAGISGAGTSGASAGEPSSADTPASGHLFPAGNPLAQPGRGPRTQRPVTPRPHRGAIEPSGRPHPAPGLIAAQRFIAVCIEILNGHRAASHLRAVTHPSDLKQITDQLLSRTNRTYLGRPGRTVTTPQRVRLVGLRMCEPRDDVVEVAAVLGYGMQTWAMAVRMERPADTWLCKLIQVI